MEKTNSLCALKQKPIVSVKTLLPSQPYERLDFKYNQTKYGKRLLAKISEGIVCLPTRFNILTEMEIDSILHSNVALTFEELQKIGKYTHVAYIKFVQLCTLIF